MRTVLLASLALLGACAASPLPIPAVTEVRVPIAVACHPPDVPAPVFATFRLRSTDSLQTKVRALLAERQQRLGYEARLRAALQACR